MTHAAPLTDWEQDPQVEGTNDTTSFRLQQDVWPFQQIAILGSDVGPSCYRLWKPWSQTDRRFDQDYAVRVVVDGAMFMSPASVGLVEPDALLHGWHATARRTSELAVARRDFERSLLAAFEDAPLDDGVIHPAEQTLSQVLADFPEAGPQWLAELAQSAERPELAANIIRCLGRLRTPVTATWRQCLVQAALRSQDLEVRDAAIQAAESWCEIEMLPLLRAHTEPEDWLNDYIRQVITDFNAENT